MRALPVDRSPTNTLTVMIPNRWRARRIGQRSPRRLAIMTRPSGMTSTPMAGHLARLYTRRFVPIRNGIRPGPTRQAAFPQSGRSNCSKTAEVRGCFRPKADIDAKKSKLRVASHDSESRSGGIESRSSWMMSKLALRPTAKAPCLLKLTVKIAIQFGHDTFLRIS